MPAGTEGYLAGKILVNKGYKKVRNLSGGLLIWPFKELVVKRG